jgi:CubicO group peptidase (beta-lactamase class C family)
MKIRPSRRSVLTGLAGSALAATLAWPARAAMNPPSAGDRDAAIDALMAHAVEASPFPGAVLAIEQGGRILYRKAFGFLDLENRIPVTTETAFPIGSITKTMTGLLVNQLVAEGRIDLAAPTSHYLPDLAAPAAGVPVRNLLDHTSGLVNYIELPDFPWSAQRPFTREEMTGWFAARPLQFPTGTRYSYTNSGLYLLGLILERVSGKTYDVLLQERIFAPFGMARSSMAGWETILPNRARGYLRGADGLRNAPRYDQLVPFSAGAVISTADDLLRYRRGVFGAATSPEVRRLIQLRGRLPSGLVIPYTQGCLGVAEFEGHRKIFHPGEIFGFSSQYSYYPDDDLTVILLTNMQGGRQPPVSLEQKIARVALGLPPLATADLPLPAATGDALAGDYETGEIRFGFDRLGFVHRDGKLALVPGGTTSGGPAIALLYQGDQRFASPLDDEQRFAFIRRAGRPEMHMTYYGSLFVLRRI